MLSSRQLGSPHEPAGAGEKSQPPGVDQAGATTDQAGATTAHAINDVLPYQRHRSNQKAWREKNREHIKQYMKRWWAQNPEKKRSYKYANKKNATTTELVGLMAAQGGACALCGDSIAQERHLDHKLPKSRGGVSDIKNYQWLCPSCNAAKGVMTNEELLVHIRKILARCG